MLSTFDGKIQRLLRDWIEAEGLGTFAPHVRSELAKLIGGHAGAEAVEFIEATCAICGYADASEHRDMNRSVLRLLRARGVSLGRGKRTRPEMRAFVEDLVPIAIAADVPLRCGENARLVRILRLVADSGLGMRGDPRGELRRLVR
ncbi:MAG: hypothetical protein U1F67_12915, partial [Rubrivivax sp.]